MDVAKSNKVDIINDSGNCKNKTVKRLFFKNFYRVVEYLLP